MRSRGTAERHLNGVKTRIRTADAFIRNRPLRLGRPAVVTVSASLAIRVAKVLKNFQLATSPSRCETNHAVQFVMLGLLTPCQLPKIDF